MSTFLACIFLMAMVFATGAVEADSFFLGFGFTILGIVSGIGALYFQSKNEKKEKQLYYYKED